MRNNCKQHTTFTRGCFPPTYNPQASTIPCPQQNGKGWNQLDWAQPSANASDNQGWLLTI